MTPEEREYYERLKDLDAAVNTIDFADMYGFEHNCRCAEDWAMGAVGTVSECYTKMTNDALEACMRMKGELAEKDRELASLRLQMLDPIPEG